MPIELPNLDDRTYDDLVQEALSMIPTYAPDFIFHSSNESGPPTGDGFRLRYDSNFFGSNQDGLVIEKTDGNAGNPDGGIAFVNTGNDGIEQTSLVIRGTGNVGIGTKNPTAKLVVTGGETTLQQ